MASAAICYGLEKVQPQIFAAWHGQLTPAEKLRADGFRSPLRLRQFVAARHLLKSLLTQQLEIDAALDISCDGAPSLSQIDLYCSIAHSSDAVFVAYSKWPIGVDIEILDTRKMQRRNYGRLVKEFFPAENELIFNSLPQSQRVEWFYRQWTAREAAAKMTGEGLSLRGLCEPLKTKPTMLMMENFMAAIAHEGPLQPQILVCTDVNLATVDGLLLFVPLSAASISYRAFNHGI